MKLEDINVLHINNTLGYGGVEKVIYQICTSMKNHCNSIVIASSGGAFASKLEEEGFTHYKIPDLSTKNPKTIFKLMKMLKKIVKENNINVIHCHHRMAVFYAKRMPGNPVIIYNNHTIYSDKQKLSNKVLSGINLIADGNLAKENLTNYFGLKDNGINVIYNAVEPFEGQEKVVEEIQDARNQGKFIVLNSARLHPQKGMHYYIDAAAILKERGCNIQFFIVGDGELKVELLEQVQKLGLEDSVTFLGFRDDIKNVISQSDLLVLTSVYEGLPLTPMEAFSVGKCVVATDIDGTREVVTNEVDGLLVETKNPVSIADGIQRIYDNPEERENFERNAQETYKSKFCIDIFAKNYIEYYKKL